MTQVTISNTPPRTVARRGRKTGETYQMFLDLPFDQWARVEFLDRNAAVAAASTMRGAARREGVGISVLTDREDECVLHVLKIGEARDETAD